MAPEQTSPGAAGAAPGTAGAAPPRPLHVVSLSLGSPTRDHRVRLTLLGREVLVERVGVESLAAYRRRLLELDGKVDAIGIGGANLALSAGSRTYPIRDVVRLVQGIRTPVVDGSGLKRLLEKQIILEILPRDYGVDFRGKRVLLVSSVDRYGMAEAFTQAGADVRFGDFMFALGLPISMRGLTTVKVLAAILLPVLTRLPFTWLYPTGDKQEVITPRFGKAYAWAEVLAGDFHFIRRYMPEDLRGKIIITNTLTVQDVEELRRRGVRMIVTPSPNLEGRSLATNAVQAMLVALAGRRPEELTPQDYLELLDRIGFRPRVELLNP
ncbi:MAG: quinate 5-dehydrogenase [Armatimonadota bacterium]|nr:quinate 5-dehydrogenase [Armatimonadota bacterium]MDR7427312.1 quinate 5-dehydrogenase [Armatimonadota bacterium]MDR7463868.1 quinate 5-dehydrogenase [Armatimonadota bacterium]MDR7469934.1 quinate 5-dehydrogenase [Armatimonadota bacterium]MDR7474619.1 quinate 5-dehydrogenase [Armatimonadota bacterium]